MSVAVAQSVTLGDAARVGVRLGVKVAVGVSLTDGPAELVAVEVAVGQRITESTQLPVHAQASKQSTIATPTTPKAIH